MIDSLDLEMDAIFATNEYLKASTRLGQAQRSLHLLVSSPDYLDRKNLLVKLLNRLEAALSPLLVAALTEHDRENVRMIYTCFETVGKSEDFYSFYYKAKKGQVIKEWEAIDVGMVFLVLFKHQSGWLDVFLGNLLSLLTQEYNWCAIISASPKKVIKELIGQVFSSLKPSLSKRLEGIASDTGDQAISVLIDEFRVAVEFGLKLEVLGYEDSTLGHSLFQGLCSLSNCL
jgi:hypothetical protein